MKRRSKDGGSRSGHGSKKASKEHLTVVFIDEAGFYLLPGIVRSYAPEGSRPILKAFLGHEHLSVMGGITTSGGLYTTVRDRALSSRDSVRFLKQLRGRLGRSLMVIWDGSPIHRKEVKSFMGTRAARGIELEQLPPYAPDLNPDEEVWQHLKHVELRNLASRDLDGLRHELTLAINRMRSKPTLIQSFFAGAGLPIKC